jgi:hypothetical protein
LTFEGEYLNGQKIKGQIKEYDDKGRLVFEGGLLYGKKHGKGKEYQYGNLIFDGDYFYGKRWNGYGKDYNKHNELIFRGEYINGVKIIKENKIKIDDDILF